MAERAPDTRTRPLITPEGVDLRVRLATVSERAIALIADLAIIVGVLIALTFAAAAAARYTNRGDSDEFAGIIWLLGFFVLRNFYFTLFECGARAATPGKRMMRLRVAARNGKALSADAVVARNAMRELEIYLPLSFLFSQGSGVQAWIILFGIIWCGLFVLFPLFNRDALRVGDIIAGTWVVQTPRQALLPDLAGERAAAETLYPFSEAQLSVYGVKELQVLENVLRISEPNAMAAVAERIQAKIGWKRRAIEGDYEFLTAYYQALRRRLEQKLLFGVRKKDKHDTRG